MSILGKPLNILNKVQSVRQSYTWTSADTIAGFAIVPITWIDPFLDTLYTVVWGVNDLGATVDLNYFVGDLHSKTDVGFNAIVRSYSPSYGTPGDILIVNAIGIHD